MTGAALRSQPAVPPAVAAALAAFGLAGLSRVTSLYAHAPVYRVRGAGFDYVIKRSGMVHSGAPAIDRWVRHLAARGVATVTSVAGYAPNPRRMADGHDWVLYPFIAGAPYGGSAGEIVAAGALLGHMHSAGGFNDHGLAAYFRPPARDEGWIDRHAAAACAAMRAHGVATAGFRARLAARRMLAPPPGGLPMAGGSFDFKASNLVFTPAPVLVDPDHGAFLPRVYDMAVAALLFHDDLPTAPDGPWTRAEWLSFLAGYGRIIRLDAAECAAWPAVLCRAWLDQAVWLLGNCADGWADPRERAFLTALAELDLDAYTLP